MSLQIKVLMDAFNYTIHVEITLEIVAQMEPTMFHA